MLRVTVKLSLQEFSKNKIVSGHVDKVKSHKLAQ